VKIDSCTFGEVVIDGKAYTRDVILLPDRIIEDWWRREGHSLVPEDLPLVFERRPALFVMGCGQYRTLKVPEETRRAFQEAKIELMELDTPAACKELNRLFAEGADAAGGLHLTC
jgi:hypothetical protein